MNIYRQLAEGGGYNLPFLIHIYDQTTDIYVINDTRDVEYGGKLYKSSTFNYQPQSNGAASLDIEIIQSNNIINILENNTQFNLDVVGVFQEEEVTPIEQFKHKYCTASWDGKTLQLQLKEDDRLNMTFPALIFNSYNNRGNA